MLRNLSQDQVVAKSVEMMNTPLKRTRGMLVHKKAPSSYAAIFKLPFCGFFPLVHCFGMKFPIDIIFCGHDQKIKHIFRSVQPNRMRLPLKHILGGCPFLVELSRCESSELSLGDKLSWSESLA